MNERTWEGHWDAYWESGSDDDPADYADAEPIARDAHRAGYEVAAAEYRAAIREVLDALKKGTDVVPFLLSVIASGEALSASEVAEIRSHYREALAVLDALAGEEATDA